MNFRPDSTEELLAGCDARTRRLVVAARKAIAAAVPEAVERFRPGWGLIGYNAPAYFAFIHAEPGRVRIGFEWGVALPDPAGMLEGDGRQVRHVTLRSPADLRRAEFLELLRAAATARPPGRRPRSRD